MDSYWSIFIIWLIIMSKFTSFSTGFSGIRGRGFLFGEFIVATGGDIVTTAGFFKTHVFKNSGIF